MLLPRSEVRTQIQPHFFLRTQQKHLKTFHNINKRAERLKSLPALFISMMHSNQTITRTCLLGQVPANNQTKPLLN